MTFLLRILSPPALALLAWLFVGSVTTPVSAADDHASEDTGVKYQATYVWQGKRPFSERYSGQNSLSAEKERSYSATATIFAGARLWNGGEIYFNPEMALGLPLSGLTGLGGFTNGEMARTSGTDPTFYRARLFLRQTWGLGGDKEWLGSDQNQLAGTVDANRVVLTAGNLSVLDVFDDNAYSHEPRRQFLNWSLMTHGGWDFPADSRGYTWGAALEYITPRWSLRGGRFLQPKESNGLPLNTDWRRSYGDAAELEKPFVIGGRPGKLRLLWFRNVAVMGSFGDAMALAASAGGPPDLSAVRRRSSKAGAGVNIEQELADNAGMFVRASRGDGRTETYAFTEIDRSTSAGLVLGGERWARPGDEAGIAMVRNELSSSHRDYLAAGGLGFFLGDGALSYQPERIVEAYYSHRVTNNSWLTLGHQQISNPGYNADRKGPVQVWTLRLHAEF